MRATLFPMGVVMWGGVLAGAALALTVVTMALAWKLALALALAATYSLHVRMRKLLDVIAGVAYGGGEAGIE